MLPYRGRFPVFDTQRIRLYPLAERRSKVGLESLKLPEDVGTEAPEPPSAEIRAVAQAAGEARRQGRPVVVFTGAHLIKNGFGPLLRNLVERGVVTLAAMNAAGMIHELELALVGRTSEDVPRALPRGEFGFARETGTLLNAALGHGERIKVGAGEALGRLITGEPFPEAVAFPHERLSVAAGGWRAGVPITMHAAIGTDIIDQFPDWDPAAKGGCSGRDFLIFCAEIERMAEGGVFINIGSAVTGPEVFLKACSMCANVGRPPRRIVTASLDLKPADPAAVENAAHAGYYQRDVKSVVVRVPRAFGGQGYYIEGDHRFTVPALYRALVAARAGGPAESAIPVRGPTRLP